MAPSAQAHKRSHSLLLFQKLLNLRDSASPLTLVLDTLEQSATPLIDEFITRAKISHTKIIFISFATIKRPSNADVFIRARGKPLEKLRAEVASHCPPPTAPTSKAASTSEKTLLIIDTLNPLSTTHPRLLTTFLSSLLTHPAISLPHPLTVLNHLATAVLRVSNLYQAVERRRAQNRSLPEPEWGLDEGREGVLVGVKAARGEIGGVVVEMELRRRSGRAVVERFVLVHKDGGATGVVSLLSDHALFAAPEDGEGAGDAGDDELAETTFNLGLTEKQRKDREGIVLPYFDAQEDVGGGEGEAAKEGHLDSA
ncbi:Elongator complex protein 5 [Cytospora mali]|uniref:Elongator complex protein 5 n=1 Tax=Cytospora mali TaxID=578113 RepID=A0A194UME8_CYTMA|nr:Elongator complex protein 5 [Valsa mali var. pyri (nom. inval.)]